MLSLMYSEVTTGLFKSWIALRKQKKIKALWGFFLGSFSLLNLQQSLLSIFHDFSTVLLLRCLYCFLLLETSAKKKYLKNIKKILKYITTRTWQYIIFPLKLVSSFHIQVFSDFFCLRKDSGALFLLGIIEDKRREKQWATAVIREPSPSLGLSSESVMDGWRSLLSWPDGARLVLRCIILNGLLFEEPGNITGGEHSEKR